MIHCNQVCMYNFPDDGCLKPKSAVCPMSNVARDTNVLTNADHIRSMTDEELADFLCDATYKENEQGYPIMRTVNKVWWRKWLRQPYEEAAE